MRKWTNVHMYLTYGCVCAAMNEKYPSHKKINLLFILRIHKKKRHENEEKESNHAYMKPIVLFILSNVTQTHHYSVTESTFCMENLLHSHSRFSIFFLISLILTLWKRGSKDEKKKNFFSVFERIKGKKFPDWKRWNFQWICEYLW